MKVLSSISLLLLFLAANAFSQNETEIVNRLKAKLDRITDYTANGLMITDVIFIKTSESKVVIYYRKPDHFKVIKEGGISILPKGNVSINSNSLLQGGNFTVIPVGLDKIEGTPVRVVKLLPNDENSNVVLSTLYIDDAYLVIRRAIVNTRENGSYQMDLSFGRFINWGLPDKVVFTFNIRDYKIPKGITFEYEKGDSKKEDRTRNNKGRIEIRYFDYKINKGVDNKIFQDASGQ